jgi:hypothetical protein
MAIQRRRNAAGRLDVSVPDRDSEPISGVSSRGKLTPFSPGRYNPGIPEGVLPGIAQIASPEEEVKVQALAKYFKPEMVEGVRALIRVSLQEAFDRYSIYTQAKPFDDYNIAVVPCAANTVTRLDGEAVSQGQTSRRALLIVNTNVVAANVLWIGKSNIAIGLGAPCVSNNGTYLVSINERAPHYGIIAAQTNVVVLWYL